MNEELNIRIVYNLTGEFDFPIFSQKVANFAEQSNLGGWIMIDDAIINSLKLTLEGRPIEIGAFITSIHTLLPKNSILSDITIISKQEITVEEKICFMIL